MSDPVSAVEPTVEATETPVVAGEQEPSEPETDSKKYARLWESRAKKNLEELEATRKRLQEFEDAGKSELERERLARERLEQELAAEREKATIAVLDSKRATLAATIGVDADLIRGATIEEVEAHAGLVSEAIKAAVDKALADVQPRRYGTNGALDKSQAKGTTAGAAAYAAFANK